MEVGTFAPAGVIVNGVRIEPAQRDANPYRAGGLRVPATHLAGLLQLESNKIVVEM